MVLDTSFFYTQHYKIRIKGKVKQSDWHVKFCGCCSCFSMKEWVSLVWKIRNWDIMTCSLLDFRKACFHFSKMGWIWKSLLWMLLFLRCCYFVWRNLLILGFRSVYGILKLSGVRSKVDFSAESILSFSLTPMWLGIQHIISLRLDIESSLLNSLIIRGFSSVFLLLYDSKTEWKFENMMNFLWLLFEMMSRAKSIARASFVKMELSIGRAFLIIILFKTAAQAVFHCPWNRP